MFFSRQSSPTMVTLSYHQNREGYPWPDRSSQSGPSNGDRPILGRSPKHARLSQFRSGEPVRPLDLSFRRQSAMVYVICTAIARPRLGRSRVFGGQKSGHGYNELIAGQRQTNITSMLFYSPTGSREQEMKGRTQSVSARGNVTG